MSFNTTSADDKLTCTDFVDFGDNSERFGRISWTKIEKNGANMKFLDIQAKLFKKDSQGEFRMCQKIGMGERHFNDFMRMKNELVIAVAEFRKLQNLQPAPENFTRDMEDQLKMMHQVYNVVDQPHRKIYVTMLRYKVDNPDSTYVQIRLFGKMQKDGNFVQLTYVNYKQQEFLHLLDIMDYSYAQIINNKRVSIDM